MIATTATPQLVVHEVTGTTSVEACTHESYDVRPVTLAAASYLLRMQVADFDCVRVAAALEDIKCCPLCAPRRRTAPDPDPRAAALPQVPAQIAPGRS